VQWLSVQIASFLDMVVLDSAVIEEGCMARTSSTLCGIGYLAMTSSFSRCDCMPSGLTRNSQN